MTLRGHGWPARSFSIGNQPSTPAPQHGLLPALNVFLSLDTALALMHDVHHACDAPYARSPGGSWRTRSAARLQTHLASLQENSKSSLVVLVIVVMVLVTRLAEGIRVEVGAGGLQRGLQPLGSFIVERVNGGAESRSAAQRAQRAHGGAALHAQPERVRIVTLLQRLPARSENKSGAN